MKQDKQPNAVARLPKFSHDLSFSRSWTSSTGHIIPVVSDFLNAGETINCTIDLKTRMQPILRPAMLEIHQKIKYFFVPMDMLYSLFGAIRYQVDDFFSSQFDKSNLYFKDGFPLVDFLSAFKSHPYVKTTSPNYENFYAGGTEAVDAISGVNQFGQFDYFHQGAHRLLDALGYDPNVVFAGSDSTGLTYNDNYCYAPKVFPYKLLAYQAIYFHYFRDEDWERNLNSAFNVDKFFDAPAPLSTESALTYCNLRYVNRYKDFFMNVHNGAVISDTSLLNSSSAISALNLADKYLADNGVSNSSPALVKSSDSFATSSSVKDAKSTGLAFEFVNYGSNYTVINASQLRLLFAVDKLLTVTSRAHKRVDDQVLAHFGFNVPLDVKHNIQYLGEQDGSFIVKDVISTADTGSSGAVLGELAGKGFGRVLGNGVKKFTAPCDGVFMGLYYSMPKVRYMTGYDRQNAVASRTDLFIPEFDHLGQQPLFHYQIDSYLASSSGNKIFGWQWRYEQWKRKFDTVSAAFRNSSLGNINTNPLSAWSPVMSPDKYSYFLNADYQGLKVTPHDLDNIMVMPFSSSPTDIPASVLSYPYQFYQRDPFLHDMFVDYKKLSVMSTFSVPNLDNNV